jgi:4-amino-4-deoxy-L-arabinose transferase-like glycosyltransferase
VPVRRSFRPALLAAAILALLAVVAVASRSDGAGRPADTEDRTLPLAFWDYLLTFGLLAMFAVLALAVFLKVPLPQKAERGRFGLIQLLAFTVIVVALVSLGKRTEWPDVTQPAGIEEPVVDRRGRQSSQQVENSERDSRPLRLRWEVFAAAGGLLVLGICIYTARRRSDARRRLEGQAAATALSAALDDSLDDLRAERDPRRAVIAAYARMERALEAQGLPRRRSEAPLEYLARVLRKLRVRSSAVLALTELFERAKFSLHQIDVEMKEEAIGALIAVRDDLRADAEA